MKQLLDSITLSTITKIRNLGIIVTLLGVSALIYPNGFGKISTVLIAVLLILGGFIRFTFAIFSATVGTLILKYLYSILMVGTGVYVLFNTQVGLEALTIVMSVFFIVDSLITVFYSISLRPIGGGIYFLLNGLSGMVIGFLVLKGWPESSMYAIGIYVGVKLLLDGVSLWFTGQTLRSKMKYVLETY